MAKLTYQMAIILNTLGPDKDVWVNKKAKWVEICENLIEAGHTKRTWGAIKWQ
jgi:hypothetical protein